MEPNGAALAADALLKQGNKKDAVPHLIQKADLTKDNSAKGKILKQIADLYLGLKNKSEAFNFYERYLKLNPKDLATRKKLYQMRADDAYSSNITEQALKDYLALEKLQPKSTQNFTRLGEMHYGRKDFKNAAKYLTPIAGKDEKLLKKLALSEVKNGNSKGALNAYQKLSNLDSKNKEYAENFMLYSEKAKVADAALIKAYQNYLRFEARNSMVALKIARLEAKNPKTREIALRKIIKLDKNNISAMLNLASINHKNKKFKENEALIGTALKLKSKSKKALKAAIKNYKSLNNDNKTVAYIEKLLKVEDHDDSVAVLNRRAGNLYKKLKKPKSAVAKFEAYLEANPDDKKILGSLLGLYRDLKNKKGELKTLDDLIPLSPKDLNLRQSRADLNHKTGNKDKALEDYSFLEKNLPKNRFSNSNKRAMGLIYFGKSNYNKSETYLSPSAGNKIEALKALAETYVKLKKEKEAIGIYYRLNKVAPKDKSYAEALVKLNEKIKAGNTALLKAYKILLNLDSKNTSLILKIANIEVYDKKKNEFSLYTIVKLDPDNTKALWQLSQIQNGKKEYGKAETGLKKLVKLKPQDGKAQSLLAKVLLSQKKKKDAIPVLKLAAELERGKKEKAWALKNIGDIYLEFKTNTDAFSYYDKYLKVSPKDNALRKKLYQLRADFNHSADKKDQALKDYLALEKLQPKVLKNHEKIGLIYYSKKDNKKSIQYLKPIARVNEALWKKLAQSYINLKQNKPALQAYKKLFSLDSINKSYAKNIIKYSEAIKASNKDLLSAYKQYLILDPENKKTALKKYRLEEKDPKKREKSLKKIIELDPGDATSILKLVGINKKKKRFKQNESLLDLAYKTEPKNSKILVNRSFNYRKLGKKVKLIKALEDQIALSKAPKDLAVFYSEVSNLYIKEKDKKKGLTYLEKFLEIKKKDDAAHKRVLALYVELKDLDGQLKTLSILIKLSPKKLNYRQSRAKIYSDKKDTDKALKDYEYIQSKSKKSFKKNDISMGLIYYSKQRYIYAEEYLSRSVGRNVKALKALADTYLKQKKEKEAIGIYYRLNKVAPKDKSYAEALVKLNEKIKAGNTALLKAYKILLNLDSKNTNLILKIANIEVFPGPGSPLEPDLFYQRYG